MFKKFGRKLLAKKKIMKTEKLTSDSTIKSFLEWHIVNHKELGDTQPTSHIAAYLQLIKKNQSTDGNILELGTYRGGLTIIIAKYLKKINSTKKIISCDTFEGFPYDDKFTHSKTPIRKGDFNDSSLESVQQKIESFDVKNGISLIKGKFEDTLYTKLNDELFSFVIMDCDLYDAVKFSLPFVWERLVKNGICVFDEYDDENTSLWGETKAVNEFCEKNGIKIIKTPIHHIIK